MEKLVVIEGKEIKLKTHGNIPNLYRKQFGKDFIVEINNMRKNGINIELFNNLLWLTAKEADKDILPPDEWNAGFESYPILSVVEDIQELIASLMNSKKKLNPVKPKKE